MAGKRMHLGFRRMPMCGKRGIGKRNIVNTSVFYEMWANKRACTWCVNAVRKRALHLSKMDRSSTAG